MENSLIFLYIVFGISILLHVLAGFITAAFVIPLQKKEAGIHNGLIMLRRQLLIKGILAFVVIIASVIALTGRYFISDISLLRYIITTMILLHSLGIFGKSIIDYKIYHQQYSPKSRELHRKIEILEKKQKLDKTAEKGVK